VIETGMTNDELSQRRWTVIYCAIAALVSAMTVSCNHPQPSSHAFPTTHLFGGKVALTIPASWIKQQHVTNGNIEIIQFEVPDQTTETTPDSANAIVSVEPLQTGATVTNFGDARLFKGALSEGNAVLTDFIADARWRTALSRGQQGSTPYVIMDRFGVDRGVMVLLRLAQPVFPNNGSELAHSVSNFNLVVSSLKIGGTNTIDSQMRMDNGTVWLRHFSDQDTNWMSKTGVVWRAYQPSQP
jgi:hypothetical protein